MKPCAILECPKPHFSRGYCKPHYRKWRRWGDPLFEPLALKNRLARHVVSDSGCWEWQGAKNDRGYGQVGILRKVRYAHRVSYAYYIGPIPDDFEVDHLCSNPGCINPEHLEAVSRSENVQRAWDRGERQRPTHCKYGHELVAPNVYKQSRGPKAVGCVECRRRDSRNAYRRKHGIPEDAPVLHYAGRRHPYGTD